MPQLVWEVRRGLLSDRQIEAILDSIRSRPETTSAKARITRDGRYIVVVGEWLDQTARDEFLSSMTGKQVVFELVGRQHAREFLKVPPHTWPWPYTVVD